MKPSIESWEAKMKKRREEMIKRTLLQQLLQPEQMSIDALSVCGPCGVLQMTSDCASEEGRSVFVLLSVVIRHSSFGIRHSSKGKGKGDGKGKGEITIGHINDRYGRERKAERKKQRTVALGSSILRTHSFPSFDVLLITSVLPSWNLRV